MQEGPEINVRPTMTRNVRATDRPSVTKSGNRTKSSSVLNVLEGTKSLKNVSAQADWRFVTTEIANV